MSELPAHFVSDKRSPLRKVLDASRSGRAVELIEFDGCDARFRGVPLALRALTTDEELKLRAAAAKWCVDVAGFGESFLLDTPEGRGTMEFEAKVQTIALALCEPAPPHAPVAASADELRGLLFADEVAALFELYVDFVTKRSPISAAKSAEEVASLVDSLGKGTTPLQRLSTFDAVTLRSIVRELVARWTRLTSSPSSPTPPSTDTGSDSPETSD
jgi:hypothetical protein